ncbi:MAG: efflux RND transporter periplasmic adaptor subunit [Acidobacteriota bacterium]|nr:efflux RND transporter periplasmic adaptor subunit [Acidobacteriota bacterium]
MSPAEPTRRNPAVTAGVIVALVLAALAVARMLTRDSVTVRATTATRQNLISTVSTNGKVEPIDEFEAHASAPGIVKHLFVDVGEKVKVGQPLVTMDDADATAHLATATAAVTTAQAALHDMEQGGNQEERLALSADLDRARQQQAQAQTTLTALEKLQQQGAASAAEVSDARARLAAANSSLSSLQQRSTSRYSATDLARARAQLADAQAQLSAAKTAYQNVAVHSPIAGTVYSIPVSQYDFVPAGDDLLDVADLDHIQIRAYFDEPEIGKLAAGQPVKIVWDARPNRLWHGTIEVAPTTVITYGTRNVGECIITVDDAHGDLLPNTNVTVTVTTSQASNVLSIPHEALHTDGPLNFVYRIVGGKLVRTPVQLGVVNLTRVEITSGLSENDVVALNATDNRDLTNGLAVKTAQ